MLTPITLKCPNCGANVEIDDGAESFACPSCGASQTLVDRSIDNVNYAVSLELPSSAGRSKIQAKTTTVAAAQLTIERLDEELDGMIADYESLDKAEDGKRKGLRQIYMIIWIIVCFASVLVTFIDGWFTIVLSAILLFVSTVAVYLFFADAAGKNTDFYDQERKCLSKRMFKLCLSITENREIADKR